MKKITLLICAVTFTAQAELVQRDYTVNGVDFTGQISGSFVWGMDINPINNVANVDVDANGTKDFHESGSTAVVPDDGLASNADGLLFRMDYGGSPSRAAGLEAGNNSYTLEFALDMKSTGTEGTRGVFGIAPEFTGSATQGRIQWELKRTGSAFQGGAVANTILSPASLAASNLGMHTWRVSYDATNTEFWLYRDGVLQNINGAAIPGSTNLGNPSITLFGDYSSGLGGDWELDYLVLDPTGAYAPSVIPEPSSTALLGLGAMALFFRRRK